MEEIKTQQQREEFTKEEVRHALEILKKDQFLKEQCGEDAVFIPAVDVAPSWDLVREQCIRDYNSDNPNLRHAALIDAKRATLSHSNNYEPKDYQHPKQPGGIATTSVRLPNNKMIDFFIAVPVKLPKIT